MSEADWRDVLRRVERCRLLGHPDALWVRRHAANDAVQICYWCDTCGRPVTQERYGTRGAFVSADALKTKLGIDPESIPTIRRDARYALCSRCWSTSTCEMHHTAMQAAFEDADQWPVIPLCGDCHRRFTGTYEAYVQLRIAEAIARLRDRPAA